MAQYRDRVHHLLYATHVKLIALISHRDELHTLNPLILNLSGCLLVSDLNESLVHIIRAVTNGIVCFSRNVVEFLLPKHQFDMTQVIGQKYTFLSTSEQKILYFIVLGETNQQIAQKLGFSHQTIRNYVKSIYSKIGVHNRAALFAHMYQQT